MLYLFDFSNSQARMGEQVRGAGELVDIYACSLLILKEIIIFSLIFETYKIEFNK